MKDTVIVSKDCCYHLDQWWLLLLLMLEYKKNKLLELSLPSETVKKMNANVSWFISANELSGINTKTELEHSVTL